MFNAYRIYYKNEPVLLGSRRLPQTGASPTTIIILIQLHPQFSESPVWWSVGEFHLDYRSLIFRCVRP
ncbi:hypothetical protein, partial [Anabaena sp. CCY 9402-a]|uniref:hypothetical protein n=1 Tax=Anabaena sp. CCY 9402-a TaxID=3103867 RepID=UPI0039C6FE3C